MITYLLSFVLCSGLLLLVYRLFLSSENLYKFNRFFLLFSLVFSLAVPLITVRALPRQLFFLMPKAENTAAMTPAEKPLGPIAQPINLPNTAPSVQYFDALKPSQQQVATVANNYNYPLLVLVAFYLVIAGGLLIRYVKNLYYIRRLVAKNTRQMAGEVNIVLINEQVTPHSFLKYVFLNKTDYLTSRIEPEIICHEQTHVRQLHSLDVLFIEFLQVICWFNPFIPLYRKAIQLNHEFLADEAVIANYHNATAYQHLVLAKASQYGSLTLTSQFNYLTTKKRLIMMTKITSAKIALCKKLALAPVIVCSVLLFSHKVAANDNPKPATSSSRVAMGKRDVTILVPVSELKVIPPAKNDAPQGVLTQYNSLLIQYNLLNITKGQELRFAMINMPKADRLRLQNLYDEMSRRQRQNQLIQFGPLLLPAHATPPTDKQFALWTGHDKYRILIDGKEVSQAELAKSYPAEFAHYNYGGLKTKTDYKKYKGEVYLMTPAYFKKDNKQLEADHYQIPMLNAAYRQAADAVVNPDSGKRVKAITAAAQDAPQAVLDEFVAILKKYNIPADNRDQVRQSSKLDPADKARLETLYVQMSKEQQKNQWVVFVLPTPPPAKSRPTAEQLVTWQDAANYGVWIDDKRIKNTELAKYKPTDFDHMFFSRLLPVAVKNDGFHYQVDLLTPAAYAKLRKEMLSQTDWNMWRKMKPKTKDI